jgi:hypothetical protein
MAAKLPTFDELLSKAVATFEEAFKKKPELAACAPGLKFYITIIFINKIKIFHILRRTS